MLKAELIRPRLELRDGQVFPLALPADYHALNTAGELAALFQRYTGHSRGQLTEALRDYEGVRLDYPVIRGLAAVLEARCTFVPPSIAKASSPAEVRAALFRHGPVTDDAARQQALAQAAAALALTPAEIEAALLADLAEAQILLDPGPPAAPAELIARYNLEVARGLLYWARELRLELYDSYKDIFKFIKLFKLMYTIRPTGEGGYSVTLHGPISPFVTSTIRYGLQFAKFLPALLLCRRWRMEADIQLPGIPGREPARYRLDDQTELRSHFKPSPEYDSQLEADFAAEFAAKYGGARRRWRLAREDELLLLDDSVMIPDFSLTHRQDGRRALLEIVGFWHPDYLRRKLAKVRQAGRRDLILLVYESAKVAAEVFETAAAGEVLRFSRKPVLKEVLAAVERCAAG